MTAGGSGGGSFATPSLVMSTPPQTPRSAASSVSGAIAGPSGAVKRDVEVVKEDEGEGEGPEKKRRRVVPDLVEQK